MSDHNKEIDHLSGVSTTGHEWDGLKELNNPLPRWWLWTWYACIVWAIGYWVLYPSWPLVSDYTRGVLGHSNREEGMQAYESLISARLEQAAGLKDATVEEILADDNMRQFAVRTGGSCLR